MITVGLYKKTTKISPENDERHFYQRAAEVDIEAITPSVSFEIDGKMHNFFYDEAFSKEVGHHAYVLSGSRLTPLNLVA